MRLSNTRTKITIEKIDNGYLVSGIHMGLITIKCFSEENFNEVVNEIASRFNIREVGEELTIMTNIRQNNETNGPSHFSG